MHQILFSPNARKQFLKLEKPIQKRISIALRRIRFKPERYVSKLVGVNAYRLRVGKYRLILDIKDKQLLVLCLGHRKNIYKKL
jgi:mRNA interferase RelE/StbE